MDVSNISRSADVAKFKSTRVDNLSEPKNVPEAPKDREGDRDNSIGQDSLTLSREALNLASTSVTQAVNNQTQIPGEDKAKEVATQAAESIRNNPGQAQVALSSVSSSTVNRLLSGSFVAA